MEEVRGHGVVHPVVLLQEEQLHALPLLKAHLKRRKGRDGGGGRKGQTDGGEEGGEGGDRRPRGEEAGR